MAIHGGVRVSELVELLGVSDMTVRRDIDALAARGLVARVHGGATAAGGRSAEEPGFVAKSDAADHREGGDRPRARSGWSSPVLSVALSAGTTTYEVAPAAAPRRAAHRRHELDAGGRSCCTRTGRADMTVVLTGGIRTPSDALVGPVAVGALQGLHVDWLFMGVHGIDVRAGFTTPNLVEGETDRALIACARQVVVAADSTKWGVVGLTTIAGLDEVDVLVTDDGLPPGAHDVLGRAGRTGWSSRRRVERRRRGADRMSATSTRADPPHRATGSPTAARSSTSTTARRTPTARRARCTTPATSDRAEHAGEMRLDLLTGEWVAIAAHRMNRTFMPPADECPLCPTRPRHGAVGDARRTTTTSSCSRTGSRRSRPRRDAAAGLVDGAAAVAGGAGGRTVRGDLLHQRPRHLVRHADGRTGCAP